MQHESLGTGYKFFEWGGLQFPKKNSCAQELLKKSWKGIHGKKNQALSAIQVLCLTITSRIAYQKKSHATWSWEKQFMPQDITQPSPKSIHAP